MNSEHRDSPSRADREFQELLGSTGGREPVDPRRLAEIKEAIRPAWQQMVEARRAEPVEDLAGVDGEAVPPGARDERSGPRASWSWLAAAAALTLTLGGWWFLRGVGSDVAVPASFTVARAQDAFVVVAGERRRLRAGETLDVGVVVHTESESGAFVSLVDDDVRSIRLAPSGQLALAGERDLELLEGRVYVDHEPSDRGAAGEAPGVSVRTSLGTVHEIGTQFEVELRRGPTQTLHAVVRTGRVLLEAGSVREQARAGQELVLEDGEVARRAVDPASDRWAWVLASAPPFELHNATTDDVLHWLARETGRRLVYASDALEREMQRTAIETGRESVTVDEALAMLPATGIEVRLEGAELRVRDANP